MKSQPRKFAILASTLVLLAASSAGAQTTAPLQVASLGPISGKVMINKGKGFVAASQGTMLAPGDRLIALNGSTAAIVYPDGCVAEVRENSLLAVDKRTQCSTRPVSTGITDPIRVAQAIGGTATDARPQANDEYCSEEARKRRADQRRAAGLPPQEDDGCPPLVPLAAAAGAAAGSAAAGSGAMILGVATFAGFSAFTVNRVNNANDTPISAR